MLGAQRVCIHFFCWHTAVTAHKFSLAGSVVTSSSSSSFYLFSKMQKIQLKKTREYWTRRTRLIRALTSLYMSLRAYSLSNHIQWKRRNTHTKNIKNTTLKHRKKLEKSTFWMERRNLESELKLTTLSGREFQVFMMRSLKNAALKREALCLNNLYWWPLVWEHALNIKKFLSSRHFNNTK